MLIRRGFLKGGITLGLASFGPLSLFTSTRRAHASDLHRFSKKKFESFLGSWLHLDMGEGAGSESVQLVDVLDRSGAPNLEQFSIRFRTRPQLELQPGICTVDDGSEAFDLYLEPAGSDSAGRYCSALFSLILP